MEELKEPGEDTDLMDEPVHDDYELVAYSKLRIDFEYIVELLQGFVASLDPSLEDYDEASFEAKIRTLREIIAEFSSDNPKLSVLLTQVVDEIECPLLALLILPQHFYTLRQNLHILIR